MIAVMDLHGSEAQREAVLARLEALGLRGEIVRGEQRTVIAVLGQVFP